MKSLIFFLSYLVCVFGEYISPNNSSIFYVNNTYNIEWNFPYNNQNLTHIFLTHDEPFKLSKFSNNQMVLSSSILPEESNYTWDLPYDLNYYRVEDINWRILLSNSSTPYSGSIGSHSVDSIIYLSDFFRIHSNMNATRYNSNSVRFNEEDYFVTNGFTDTEPINYYFSLKNSTHSHSIANFTQLPFENTYLSIDYVNNSNITFTPEQGEGNFRQTYVYTLSNLENTEFYYTPNLHIRIEQNNINRNITEIPVSFIRVNENFIDNQNSEIITNCINSDVTPCVFNLHINHNGVENIIHNLSNPIYNLIKYPGSYEIFSSIDSQFSNTISFSVFTSTLYTTTTTFSNTLFSSTLTSTWSGIMPTNLSDTCLDDENCDNGIPLTNIVAGIIAGLFFLGACYYCYKINKHNSNTRRVHPNDIEMGNRVVQNNNYETRDIQNTEHETDIDNIPSHYYPDTARHITQAHQAVYRTGEASFNNYDEPSSILSRRGLAYPNLVYAPSETMYQDPEYTQYHDNYGNKRPIRRRHSSNSYGYDYAFPHTQQTASDQDSVKYERLDRRVTRRERPTSYNVLERDKTEQISSQKRN